MLLTKTPSHLTDLRKSIKRLVDDLDQSIVGFDDSIAENKESVASYVCRKNDDRLNRSFLNYSMALKRFEKMKEV